MTWRRIVEPGMQPLLVVAEFAEPVLYAGDLLHLDSLIQAGAYEAMTESGRRALPGVQQGLVVDFHLPLARWEVTVDAPAARLGDLALPLDISSQAARPPGGHALQDGDRAVVWGWCASAELVPWAGQTRMEIRKRPPVREFLRWTQEGSYNSASGHLKAYDIPLPAMQARVQVWRCYGHEDRVRALLELVPAIGKKRHTGNGRVLSWHVETCAGDWSVERDGMATRRMPVESGLRGHAGSGTVRPVYYHRSRHYPRTVAPAIEVAGAR